MSRSDSPRPLRRRDQALLERDDELAAIAYLIEEANAQRAGLGLIEGAAGIGKSMLLAEGRRRAQEAGFRVLAGRGGELERDFSFGVVRQLFEPVLVDPRDRAELLSGAAAAESVFAPPSEADRPGAGDVSFATLHGLYWLTLNLTAKQPLLLAIDDLHWCDPPSLRFVAYLLRRLEDVPALVLATLRPADPGADAALLAEIAADPMATSLAPRPLSLSAATAIVRDRLGPEAADTFCVACHRATGGNPLLLHELLRALRTEGVRPEAASVSLVEALGPRAGGRAVLLRLARLPPEAVAVARATAVLGDGATVSEVAALADLPIEGAAGATGTLAQAEILRPEPPLGFVHPLVRETIHRDLPPGELEVAHARAAGLLSEARASPERVAAHLLLAPPRARREVVETLRAAAGRALNAGGAESAAAYLRRALEEPPPEKERAEVLLELGLAEAMGSAPTAAEYLRDAYEAQTEPEARGRAAAALTQALTFTRPPDEAVAVARQAAAELPPELSDLRQTLEAQELSATIFGADDAGMDERFERARTVGAGEGLGARMLAAAAAQHWALTGGSADECVRLSLAALADDELIRADPGFFSVIASVPLVLADRDEALEVFDAMRIEAHRTGSLFASLSLDLWRGFALLQRGDLVEAEASLREGIDKVELWGAGGGAANAFAAAFLARALVERGDLPGARRALGRGGDPHPHSIGANWWRRSELELLIAEGRNEEAVRGADEYTAHLGRRTNPAFGPWRSLKAVALDRLGRREEAIALAREELDPARRWGAPGTVGRSLRILAELERANGLGHLEEAVGALEGTPARLEQAKVLASLGTTLRLARRPSDARELLRRALELAEVCGAGPLAERARSEIYASGGRPRSTALSGVASLTPSERRVVDLAAEGESNRDIAQALFVTPKTVEIHLTRAYRKLDVGSRRELAAALERAA